MVTFLAVNILNSESRTAQIYLICKRQLRKLRDFLDVRQIESFGAVRNIKPLGKIINQLDFTAPRLVIRGQFSSTESTENSPRRSKDQPYTSYVYLLLFL